MVEKSGHIILLFCHKSRIWQTDRQTDRQTDTDRILIARLHPHSMQRSKNLIALPREICLKMLRRTFMISLLIVTPIWKTHSTNLAHCSTIWITAHSISIMSHLKMSSFGPYAGAKMRSPHAIQAVPNVQQFLNIVNSWLVHALLDKAVEK